MREVYNALPDDRPITSLCVVEEIHKCPHNYTIVSRTHDQDIDADLYKDGFFRRVTRYLCHSKTDGYLGYVVEELRVISDKESCPPGFTTLVMTMDTNQKAFKRKQICFRALSKNMARQVITDIIVLSNGKIAPEGFCLAGELNGMCVCYKTGAVQSPGDTSASSPSSASCNLPYQMGPHGGSNASGRSGSFPGLYPGLERPSRPAPLPPGSFPSPSPQRAAPTAGSDTYEAANSALYGVPFQCSKKYVDCSDGSDPHPLPPFTAKSPQQLESQYYYSFSLEQDVLLRQTAT
uniref:Multivesicular body subunit 12B-like n=2 Tax=Hirondellea gigas TaxID=1518452 RepID=A0A2P2I4P1_9CRUS